MKRKAAVCFCVAALLTWSGSSTAGSLDTMGASSRGTAMGGAMVSIANGFEATYYNASALALSRNSWGVQATNVTGELMLNDEDTLQDGVAFRFGINHRFLRERVGLGLIVGTSAASGGGLSLDFGALGGGGAPNWSWSMYQDSMPLVLSVGFGFRITDWLSIGVTGGQKDSMVSMGYFPLVVDPLLESLIGISTGVMPSNIENYNFAIGGDPDSDITYGFNATIRILDYISLGYVYKPEAWSRYKLRVELVGGGGSILPNSQYILIDMKVPGQVETTIYGAAGHIPIRANDGTLTLAWAHEIQNWEGFYPSSVQYQWDAVDSFNKEWFTLKEPRDPGLEDVEFDRFGFEYEGDASFITRDYLANPRFYVRGGYYARESPQPDVSQSWQVAMVDSDAEVYSFGIGFAFDRKGYKKEVEDPMVRPSMQIDLHFQQIVLDDRDYIIKPDKFGNIPLDNYYVESSGGITSYGVQVTWWQ